MSDFLYGIICSTVFLVCIALSILSYNLMNALGLANEFTIVVLILGSIAFSLVVGILLMLLKEKKK